MQEKNEEQNVENSHEQLNGSQIEVDQEKFPCQQCGRIFRRCTIYMFPNTAKYVINFN